MATGFTANNYTEVKSGWLPASFFDEQGIIAIDYYGNNHTPQELDDDLREMARRNGHPIFLEEWGDYWNSQVSVSERTQYLGEVYARLQRMADDGVLAGFNYWGGWDNTTESLLMEDHAGFHLNFRGEILGSVFAGNP